MAQLTDDCFAFSGPLLPVDEVERIIRARVTPVAEIETVALNAASGRVVARDIVAPIDLPPFDNSAVDGYAVRHADLDAVADTRLAIVERVTAGRAAARALAAGAAVRIFTGAPMPAGADTVFMQEDVQVERPRANPGPNRATILSTQCRCRKRCASRSRPLSPSTMLSSRSRSASATAPIRRHWRGAG